MLEELFGGGKSSPPPSNNNTQPTTQPSSPPPASEPTSGTTEPVEDETAEDDMVTDHDDGTYSPAPVANDNNDRPEDVGAQEPADEPAASHPVNSGEETETEAPSSAPVATAPPEDDERDEDAGSESPQSQTPADATPAPSVSPNGNTTVPVAPGQHDGSVGDVAATPETLPIKADPVTRITDLIAGYEKLLSEPAAGETDEARTRAMELAQNRVLTNLIDSMSMADARLELLDDGNDDNDRVSLINRYYAEAGR